MPNCELLAQCSNVLQKVVALRMKDHEVESISIEAVEGDINDETVMRFLEFVYTGDYTAPTPVTLPDKDVYAEGVAPNTIERASEEPELQVVFGRVEERSSPGIPSKKKKKKGNLWCETPVEGFVTPVRGLGYFDGPVPASPAEANSFEADSAQKLGRRAPWETFCSQACAIERQSWQPPRNNKRRDDCTEVFLCHARLCKFSDKYEYYDLLTLSLQKLRLTLSTHKLHQERAAAVLALLRYTYKHTMDYKEGRDKLRNLVLDYATCYIKQLMREQTFLDLLEEGGEPTGDIVRKMVDLID